MTAPIPYDDTTGINYSLIEKETLDSSSETDEKQYFSDEEFNKGYSFIKKSKVKRKKNPIKKLQKESYI